MIKKIIHISDLHFGTERSGIVNVLIADIKMINPDIIIVSGDLTQRALNSQFNAAKHFLDLLQNYNILCVPGNHDISLYNIIERFIYPFSKYIKLIDSNLHPNICQEGLAILGINSVTPFKSMGGYITEKQLEYVSNFFSEHANSKIKILVMHHNLIKSERHKIINDADKIISSFSTSKINIVLSGHIHASHIEQLKDNNLFHNMYIITAGTAISTRTKLPNSFNVLEFDNNQFKLIIREFSDGKFITVNERIFCL